MSKIYYRSLSLLDCPDPGLRTQIPANFHSTSTQSLSYSDTLVAMIVSGDAPPPPICNVSYDVESDVDDFVVDSGTDIRISRLDMMANSLVQLRARGSRKPGLEAPAVKPDFPSVNEAQAVPTSE